MAQVILNHDLAGQVRALSAGVRPQPRVADYALEALRLAGLPAKGLYPKDLDAVLHEAIDLVVTVCDMILTENRWRTLWRYATTSARGWFLRFVKHSACRARPCLLSTNCPSKLQAALR